jgi:hypothetical protein
VSCANRGISSFLVSQITATYSNNGEKTFTVPVSVRSSGDLIHKASVYYGFGLPWLRICTDHFAADPLIVVPRSFGGVSEVPFAL